MVYMKKSKWKFHQNSYTYWFTCSCGFGHYDGWGGNQEESEYCPKCGKYMFESVPCRCDECNKNSATMCLHTSMKNPFGDIIEGCRDGCPKARIE